MRCFRDWGHRYRFTNQYVLASFAVKIMIFTAMHGLDGSVGSNEMCCRRIPLTIVEESYGDVLAEDRKRYGSVYCYFGAHEVFLLIRTTSSYEGIVSLDTRKLFFVY